MYAGDSWKMGIRLRSQNSNGSAGSYLDLTGATPTAQIRDAAGVLLVDITCVLEDQDINTGLVTLSLTPAQTTTLLNGKWDFQLELDGDVRTYLAGNVTVTAEVTRI